MAENDIITLTGEKDACPSDKFSRRKFFGTAVMAAAGVALAPRLGAQEQAKSEKPPASPPADIKTNIDEVRSIPRVEGSLPREIPREGRQGQDGSQSHRGAILSSMRSWTPSSRGSLSAVMQY